MFLFFPSLPSNLRTDSRGRRSKVLGDLRGRISKIEDGDFWGIEIEHFSFSRVNFEDGAGFFENLKGCSSKAGAEGFFVIPFPNNGQCFHFFALWAEDWVEGRHRLRGGTVGLGKATRRGGGTIRVWAGRHGGETERCSQGQACPSYDIND